MNNPMNPMNPMGPQGPQGPGGPTQGPQNPQEPIDPMNQSLEQNQAIHPIYEETTKFQKLYKIIIGGMGLIILILTVLLIIFILKANQTEAKISARVEKAVEKKEKEIRDACELEKKEIRENPWMEFQARDDFGTFKFQIPRNWASYEYFDLNNNTPYSIYFNPDLVRYDSTDNIRSNHAALEVSITKKMYAQEIKDVREKIKSSKDKNASEETINISNFTGTKFVYKDKDRGKKIGVIVLPYRDRAFFIGTDDYDQWNEKYYNKFWNSFALTP